MFHDLAKHVTAEIETALRSIEEERVAELMQSIFTARCIVVHGAGRVGLVCKAFAMRLAQLGLNAYAVSDSNIPPITNADLLIVGSSSGETQTVFDVEMLAKEAHATVAAITAVADSRIATAAALRIVLNTPTKFGPQQGAESIQPMASLFEQSLQVVFDVVVLMIMKETKQSHSDLWNRHMNLD